MHPASVNDVHSALNETSVARVETPRTVEDLQQVIRSCVGTSTPLAISGARHAMGGQQFLRDHVLVDVRGLDRLVSIDHERGLVTAEAGIQWPALVAGVLERQTRERPTRPPRWGIAQKQTGADMLTLGGALSANIHGRGLTMKPIIGDVESFTLVDAKGELIECSREQNTELFALVIGGYGLFGALATVTLRLMERRKLRRVVRVIDIEDAVAAARRRIDEGFIFGDFQFDIDPGSPEFLTKGVFACYQPLGHDAPEPHAERELRPEDWRDLLHLAHTDKKRAFQIYAQHYLATDGQTYWSDTHQLGVYLDNYHEELDARMGARVRCSEMITEVYVPPDRLVDFLKSAASTLNQLRAQVIYGTIRLIQKDDESFLPWARETFACVIFNLHVEHTAEGRSAAGRAFRALIDLAIERRGSFYLTYHRFATRDQLLTAYPRLPGLLEHKDRHDPRSVFESDWLAWLRETLAD